jgi:hypothetical protein
LEKARVVDAPRCDQKGLRYTAFSIYFSAGRSLHLIRSGQFNFCGFGLPALFADRSFTLAEGDAMSKTVFPFVFFVTLFILSPFELVGQNRVDGQAGARPRTAGQHFNVTAELEREEKFLGDIAARYEEISDHDLTPLLKYAYVWNALRENRLRIAERNHHLTASQSRVFKLAYNQLEENTLQSFLDQQIRLLIEALDLDQIQLNDVQNLLTVDLSNKRKLMSDSRVAEVQFRLRLDQISDATERDILAILTPEQRKMFDRRLNFNRDRLVG